MAADLPNHLVTARFDGLLVWTFSSLGKHVYVQLIIDHRREILQQMDTHKWLLVFNAKLVYFLFRFIQDLQPCRDQLHMNNLEYQFSCLEVMFRLSRRRQYVFPQSLSANIFIVIQSPAMCAFNLADKSATAYEIRND